MTILRTFLTTDAGNEQPVLKVSTNYMETLVKLEPVSGGSDIHAFMNDSRQIDLYSVGTDLRVYRLRPQKEIRAPYTQEDLKIKARQLSLFQPLQGSNANPSILGINGDSALTLSSFSNGAYSQKVFQPAQASEKIREFLGIRGITGNIYANVLLSDDTLGNNFFSPTDLKWKSERWVKVSGPDGKEAKVKSIAMCSNSEVQSSLFAIGKEGKFEDHVLFAEDSFAFTQMRDLGFIKVSDISVVLDTNKLLNVFAVEQNTGAVWVKRQKKYSTNYKIDFDDWQKIADSSDFGAVKIKQVFANMQLDNFLEIFGIGEDGRLYHATQLPSSGTKQSWTALFPLGNEIGNSIFTVTRNYNGYSEAYTVTNGNQVIRFWQNPETSQWFSTPVAIEKTTENVVSMPTHALEVTVLDQDGVAQPGADVTLSASFLTDVGVNGLAYQISSIEKIRVKADNTGKLVINQRADSLAAASIWIETAFTGTMPVQVEPNAQLQEKLRLTTTEAVMDAKDLSGNYLLTGDQRTRQNAESLAMIMQSSMSLTGQQSGKLNYVYHKRGRLADWTPRIDMANVSRQNWEIDFSGGFPRYSALSDDQVYAYRTQNLGVSGFLGIDWGDVWQAIKEGVGKVTNTIKRIIVAVGEAIMVTFEFVIDGITKVFETVIEFVQQAFDFVEGVWNWLKVKIEKLFEWLAFIFQWGDIRRTAEVVKFNINTLLEFSVASTDHVKGVFDTWVHQLKDSLKGAVDGYINQLGGATLDNYGDQYKREDPEKEHSMEHNILLNSLKENYTDASAGADLGSLLSDSGAITGLFEKMMALADNFEFGDGKQAFHDAIAYFSNIKDNPSQALQLILSGLLKVGESIALFLIDFGAGVIKSILDLIKLLVEAFKDFLNTVWRIPIVSDIFKFITGHDLSFSVMDLVAYLISIPTCVLFKVVYKKAPFPTQQSVDDFKNTYNLAYLKSRSGIDRSPEALALRAAAKPVDPLVVNLFKTGFAVSMFAKMWADMGTAALSSVDQVNEVLGYVSLGTGIAAAAFTNPWIVQIDPGQLLCGDKDENGGDGGSNIGYLATVISVVKGVVAYVVKKKNPLFPSSAVVKVNEISSTIAGSLRCVVFVTEYMLSSKKKPKELARNLTAAIPGETIRFLSLKELNTGTYYIPVAILGVLTLGGYTSAEIIYLTDGDA